MQGVALQRNTHRGTLIRISEISGVSSAKAQHPNELDNQQNPEHPRLIA